jgi:hypothetical protein
MGHHAEQSDRDQPVNNQQSGDQKYPPVVIRPSLLEELAYLKSWLT